MSRTNVNPTKRQSLLLIFMEIKLHIIRGRIGNGIKKQHNLKNSTITNEDLMTIEGKSPSYLRRTLRDITH